MFLLAQWKSCCVYITEHKDTFLGAGLGKYIDRQAKIEGEGGIWQASRLTCAVHREMWTRLVESLRNQPGEILTHLVLRVAKQARLKWRKPGDKLRIKVF